MTLHSDRTELWLHMGWRLECEGTLTDARETTKHYEGDLSCVAEITIKGLPGEIHHLWLKLPIILRYQRPGTRIHFSGKVSRYHGQKGWDVWLTDIKAL